MGILAEATAAKLCSAKYFSVNAWSASRSRCVARVAALVVSLATCGRPAQPTGCVPAATAPGAAAYFPAPEDIGTMLRYLVEDGETPGIVLGFVDPDGSTRIHHHGSAGPGTRPLGPESVFEIGSITKTFTGALLADMVARGEVRYDDPVQKYLPDGVTMPARGDRQITLVDLSTHFSGLPRRPDNLGSTDPANAYADYTPDRLYGFLSGHELRRAPGAEYEYSNLGVGLLAHVLELRTGMSYEELVRDRILEPLGMDRSGVELRGPLAEWMTKGHDASGQVVPYLDIMTLGGAGELRSSADDMLAYLKAHLEPPQSPVEHALHATHRVRERVDENVGRTLGWQTWEPGERRMLLHGGSTHGYETMVGFDPGLGVGIVLLTNSDAFDDDLAGDFLECGPPLDLGNVPVSEQVLEDYVGLYEGGNGREVAIRLEPEGWLTMQMPGLVRFRMYAEDDSSFYLRRTPWRVRFQRDEAGEVTGLVADLSGDEMRASRTDNAPPTPRTMAGNNRWSIRGMIARLAR